MRRTPLARVSAKRRREVAKRAKVRLEVFERDGFRCQIRAFVGTECFGRPTVHHLRKASQGGDYDPENLVTACSYHNDWIEDNPARARELGLVW